MMDSYDPLTMPPYPQDMPYFENGYENAGVPNYSYTGGFVPAFDMQDSYSNYGSDFSGDDINYVPAPGLRHQALLRHTSSGFEDPFADATLSQFDQFPPNSLPDSPTVDQNHKLLSFSTPHHFFGLYDETFHGTSVDVAAQLQGNFYLGEPQWPATNDTPAPPPELTCYRRNLFSIEGTVKVPRALRYIWTEDGNRIPLIELELAVSAFESVEGNPTKLISVPFKATQSGADAPKTDDKTDREPANISLDPTNSSDLDGDYTTVPFHWKRLQFRLATQNNGRRKELQQHFVLKLTVIAKLATGAAQPVCDVKSGAIIVRGRSPRNFASRNDIPLTSGSASRRSMPSLNRNPTSQPTIPKITSAPRPIESPQDEPPQMILQYSNNELHSPSLETAMSQPQMMVPEPLPTPAYINQMVPTSMPYQQEPSPDFLLNNSFAFSPGLANSSAQPQNLNFNSDDESSPIPQFSRANSRPSATNPSPSMANQQRTHSMANLASPPATSEPSLQRLRHLSYQPSPSSINEVAASAAPIGLSRGISQTGSEVPRLPDVSNYNYVPLAPEDWQEPVNGFYAPHGDSHHGPWISSMPGGRASNKRHYAEIS